MFISLNLFFIIYYNGIAIIAPGLSSDGLDLSPHGTPRTHVSKVLFPPVSKSEIFTVAVRSHSVLLLEHLTAAGSAPLLSKRTSRDEYESNKDHQRIAVCVIIFLKTRNHIITSVKSLFFLGGRNISTKS